MIRNEIVKNCSYIAPWKSPLDLCDLNDPVVDGRKYHLFDYAKNSQKVSTFYHGTFAKYILAKYPITSIGKAPAVFNGRVWQIGTEPIKWLTDHYHENATEKQRKEVIAALINQLKIRGDNNETNPNYVQTGDVVVNVQKLADGLPTEECMIPADSDEARTAYITNETCYEYDPDAYDEVWDKFLNDISCDDKEIRAQLEEMIGAILYRSNTLTQTICVLQGEGSNGKGTLCKLLTRYLGGSDNAVSMGVASLKSEMMSVTLAGKLAAFDNDVSSEVLTPGVVSAIKKYSGGDDTTENRKFETALTFTPYATFVLSANEMFSVKSRDMNYGLNRRLLFIPFNANFSKNGDPFIYDKLDTENGFKYLTKLAIDGLVRLLRSGGKFTKSKGGEELRKSYQINNDNVLSWLEAEHVTIDCFVTGWPCFAKSNVPMYQDTYSFWWDTSKWIYFRYVDWCKRCGHTPVSENLWGRKCCKYLNMKRGDALPSYPYNQGERRVCGTNEPIRHRKFIPCDPNWKSMSDMYPEMTEAPIDEKALMRILGLDDGDANEGKETIEKKQIKLVPDPNWEYASDEHSSLLGPGVHMAPPLVVQEEELTGGDVDAEC